MACERARQAAREFVGIHAAELARGMIGRPTEDLLAEAFERFGSDELSAYTEHRFPALATEDAQRRTIDSARSYAAWAQRYLDKICGSGGGEASEEIVSLLCALRDLADAVADRMEA